MVGGEAPPEVDSVLVQSFALKALGHRGQALVGTASRFIACFARGVASSGGDHKKAPLCGAERSFL
jgi:hypothetical protein